MLPGCKHQRIQTTFNIEQKIPKQHEKFIVIFMAFVCRGINLKHKTEKKDNG